MKTALLKKIMVILCVVLMLLMIAQVAVMFIPYFELTPAPSRKVPNPVPTKYSLQEYTWTQCEEMNKIFEDEMIKAKMEQTGLKKKDVSAGVKAEINDNLVSLALVNAFVLIALLMMLQNIKHTRSKYKIAGSGAWKILAHFFCWVWIGYSVNNFLTNSILERGYNDIVVTLCLVIAAVAAVVELVNIILAILTRTRYKVQKVEAPVR